MIRILFVCLGNICRSPLAEAIFNDLIKIKGLDDKISCDSAGTAGYHIGQHPDPRTIGTAEKNNIAIDHKGRQFSTTDFDDFQYIIVMDKSNLNDVLFMGGENGKNVILMRYFDSISKDQDVPDPYYGGQAGFDDIYQILSRSSEGLLKFLIDHHDLK